MADSCKQVRVRPQLKVEQVCPLSPLNVQVAVTGTSEVRVTDMLCADDLCPTTNWPDQLQMMLDRLHVCAQWKELVMNLTKPEITHT
eukprot:1141487-Pelagomonas_calceolata.AAC.4